MQQSNHQASASIPLPSENHPSNALSHQFVIQDLETEPFLEPLWSNRAGAIYGGIVSAEKPPEKAVERTLEVACPQSSAAPASPKTLPAYWSTSLQTILDQPPSALPRNLVMGGFAFCCILGAWAWFGQIHEVSRAQGRLVPQGEVYKIQPVTQSEIAQIKVREGQSVKAGQVIAELDNRLAVAEVERLEQSLAAYQLQLIQTEGLIDRTRLEAETRQAIAAAEVQAQAAAIAQAEAKAATYEKTLPQLQAESAAYEARLARLQPLVMEGAIAEDHLFEVEQVLRQRQQAMTQSQGDLEQAFAESDRLQAGWIEKQAQARKSALEAQQKLQQLKLEATQVQAKITETETQLRAAQTKLKQMALHAPVTGTITALKIRNIGEVAQPGQTIAEISPAGAPLVLSALLPSREAGLVETGMKVQMKFDAFPYQDYGMISGKVTSISPDAEVHEQLGAVYKVEVALDRHAVTHNQQTVLFKPGETASAEIIVRQRRIMDVLLDPFTQLQKGGISL
ncbi:HlyD family efflux transporter periplasmic adaptor subunit [Phormidium tenue FACHB-886]|nr:HlyD family efflux transporter periplasmic adaptor subunit [Phormidium tenue FACHB-886]